MLRLALLIATALSIGACSGPAEKPAKTEGRWVDLTHELAEDSPFWPTAEDFRHEVASYGRTPGGWFYSNYNLELSEHGGTHLDAPIHFAAGKQTADQIPLDRLIGPAAVIDVTKQSARDRDYRFTVADVEAWERANGRLPDGAIILFRTGFSRFWPDRKAYMGTDERGPDAVAKLHFPGLSEELARFLVEQRKVAAVGLDTPSLDYGQSTDFIAHRILLGANIPGFENVADLDLLPPKGATVVALPVKIKGGSGGPLRIVAQLPPGD
jgi:kynurenine formamidase